jgi:hypothetical protein
MEKVKIKNAQHSKSLWDLKQPKNPRKSKANRAEKSKITDN